MSYHHTVDIGYGELLHEEPLKRGKGILEVWRGLGMYAVDVPVLTWRQNRKSNTARFIIDKDDANGIDLIANCQDLAVGFPWQQYYSKNIGIRDTQKTRLYAAENELFHGSVHEDVKWIATQRDAMDYVFNICDSYNITNPTVKFSQALKSTAGHYARNCLTLKGDSKFNRMIVLHELAHYFIDIKFGSSNVASHGQEFAGVIVKLYQEELGLAFEDIVDMFAKHDVKYMKVKSLNVAPTYFGVMSLPRAVGSRLHRLRSIASTMNNEKGDLIRRLVNEIEEAF